MAETKAVLSEEEASVATLYYDIHEIGDMHHDPTKNVLRVSYAIQPSNGNLIEEIARRLKTPETSAITLLESARKKMYAARLLRPTPYVDKTIYSGWNAMCVSAYLEAAKVLDLANARSFALRSLDRMLSKGWDAKHGMKHVIAYSDPKAEHRNIAGVLDDYAFSVIACLDAYEATADLSYYRFARAIADAMVAAFFDPVSGGFFDTRTSDENTALGILGTRRKPFQDSPTPSGNSAAAIALLRLHGYSDDASDREKAEQTLDVYAGVAGQHGIFAATYGLAVVQFVQPHTQLVIVGNDDAAAALYRVAARPLGFTTAVIRIDAGKLVPQNLPPSLTETLPNLPDLGKRQSFAILCSGFACQPAIFEPVELASAMKSITSTGLSHKT